MPTIYSRAQWGADESIRNKSALRYGTVSAGFVHHTVNANDYTEAEVPGILRSIYAYHVKSRGWSDIGYNFLVDRFGRIWEGRYGGVDKNVVGAHTLGYNDYAFAMSAIGNFDVVQPPGRHAAGLRRVVRLEARAQRRQPGLHGPAGRQEDVPGDQRPPRRRLDGMPGRSTSTPSSRPSGPTRPRPRPRHPRRRPRSRSPTPPRSPTSWARATPTSSFAARATAAALILPTGGLTSFSKATVASAKGWSNRPEVLISPDLTGDGLLDLVSTSEKGVLRIRPGKGNGKFKATSKVVKATKDHTLMTAVGDINKDGRNDLVARHKGRMVALLGTTKGGFAAVRARQGHGQLQPVHRRRRPER